MRRFCRPRRHDCTREAVKTDISSRTTADYALGMNKSKSDVTPDQAKQPVDPVCRQKAYLFRLHERVEKTGFKRSDPLYLKSKPPTMPSSGCGSSCITRAAE